MEKFIKRFLIFTFTMKNTLYREAREIERLAERVRCLDDSYALETSGLQKRLFEKYENNQVLYDAIQGNQSIEESVVELGEVNKGIRKILPWRKNKGHNERLEQLGELVSEPYHLHTSGIFMPDNLITTLAEGTAISFGVSYLMSKYLIVPNPDVSPEEIGQIKHLVEFIFPAVGSGTIGLILGWGMNLRRFNRLPTDEAKYLDGKVQEFYR